MLTLCYILNFGQGYVKSFETKVAMEGLLHFVSGKTVKIPEDKGDPQKVGHSCSSFNENIIIFNSYDTLNVNTGRFRQETMNYKKTQMLSAGCSTSFNFEHGILIQKAGETRLRMVS